MNMSTSSLIYKIARPYLSRIKLTDLKQYRSSSIDYAKIPITDASEVVLIDNNKTQSMTFEQLKALAKIAKEEKQSKKHNFKSVYCEICETLFGLLKICETLFDLLKLCRLSVLVKL